MGSYNHKVILVEVGVALEIQILVMYTVIKQKAKNDSVLPVVGDTIINLLMFSDFFFKDHTKLHIKKAF